MNSSISISIGLDITAATIVSLPSNVLLDKNGVAIVDMNSVYVVSA